MYYININQKKAEVPMLISGKQTTTNKITRNREKHYVMIF